MESVFEQAIFAEQEAKASLSSTRFLLETSGDRREVPIENIIAVKYDKSNQLPGTGGPPVLIQIFFLRNYNSYDLHHFESICFSCESFSPFPLLRSELLVLSREFQRQDGLQIHVVISTQSGTHKAASFYQTALRPLLGALHIPESTLSITETASAETISTLTRSTLIPNANKGINQLIILLSGDGGISDIVHTLLSKNLSPEAARPIVALTPLGTGNALFNSSCRPRPASFPKNGLHSLADATFGLRTLLLGEPKGIATLTTTFSPGSTLVPDQTPVNTLHGCVLTSWCLHASLVALSDTPTYRKMGIARFGKAAESLLHPENGEEMHLYQAKVSILREGTSESQGTWLPLPSPADQPKESKESKEAKDSKESPEKYTYLLATLVSNLEPTFTISPSSTTSPGSLHLVSLPALPPEEVMRMMSLAYQDGKHVQEKAVGYTKITGLRIEDLEGGENEQGGHRESAEEEQDGNSRGPLFRQICVDGKMVQVPLGGRVEVRLGKREVVDVLVLGQGEGDGE